MSWLKSLHESWLKKLPEWMRMSPGGITTDWLLDLVSDICTTRTIRALGFSTQPMRHGSDSVALPTTTRVAFAGSSLPLADDIFLYVPAEKKDQHVYTHSCVLNDRSVYSHDGRVRSAFCRLFSRRPIRRLITNDVVCRRLLLVHTLSEHVWQLHHCCWRLNMALTLNDAFDRCIQANDPFKGE